MQKIFLLFVFVALLAAPVFAQDDATEIGVAPSGFNAFEMVGRIEQENFSVTGFGYLNYIRDLPTEQIFAPGTLPLMRGEADARFTFYGTGSGVSRSIYENIFASNAMLEVTFYYNETPSGASFDNPVSFQSGTPIASFTMRMQSILNVQEPNVGVLMLSGESIQSGTAPFSLNGTTYTLGHDGLNHRFNVFGQGFRESEEPLLAGYLFAGNSQVIGEGVQP